ncbi:MAG: MGMT family protein, partial [Caldilineaceae bacterium]|nr:MGMT family protein [Caldilineaceae bacterium]
MFYDQYRRVGGGTVVGSGGALANAREHKDHGVAAAPVGLPDELLHNGRQVGRCMGFLHGTPHGHVVPCHRCIGADAAGNIVGCVAKSAGIEAGLAINAQRC